MLTCTGADYHGCSHAWVLTYTEAYRARCPGCKRRHPCASAAGCWRRRRCRCAPQHHARTHDAQPANINLDGTILQVTGCALIGGHADGGALCSDAGSRSCAPTTARPKDTREKQGTGCLKPPASPGHLLRRQLWSRKDALHHVHRCSGKPPIHHISTHP